MNLQTVVALVAWLVRESLSAPLKNQELFPSVRGSRIRLSIHRLSNGTYLASVIEGSNSTNDSLHGLFPQYRQRDYNGEGALYYVVAVILMYGFSIILMIGSSVRKNSQDQQAQKYMKEMSKVRRMERRQEKFKTRLLMQNRRIQNILGGARPGSDRGGEDKREGSDTGEERPCSRQSNMATVSTTPGDSAWSLTSKDGEDENGEPLLILTDSTLTRSPVQSHHKYNDHLTPEVKVEVAYLSSPLDYGSTASGSVDVYVDGGTGLVVTGSPSTSAAGDARTQLEPLHEVEEEDEGFV